MLERLNQNAENLRASHKAMSDPKIKKATVSDAQYDEIRNETAILMQMAYQFVDGSEAPTKEELQKYDEKLMHVDALSAKYLKERETNDDAEIRKRCEAVTNHREVLKNAFSDAAYIREHLSDYPQGPSKEEQTAQIVQEFKDLEKNPKALVNRIVEIRQKDLEGTHYPGKEAENDAVRRYFSSLVEPGVDGQADPERVGILDEIAKEMTRQRDELSIGIGQEMEEWEAQILRGEIPGAEHVTNQRDAARDIANELVIQLSLLFGKRTAIDNLSSVVGLNLEGKEIDKEDAYEHFQNKMLEESNRIQNRRAADAQAKEEEKALKAKEEERLNDRAQNVSCKAKDYGYEINREHREMGDPFFSKIPEDVKKLRAMDDDQIKEFQVAQNKILQSMVRFEAEVTEIASQAKKKLEELETLTIEDHEDSQFFKDMKSALEKVSKLNEKNSQEQVKKAVDDLRKASDTYYQERKGVLHSWSKVGRKRRSFAEEMRDLSAVNFSRMEQTREGLSPKGPVRDQMDKLNRIIDHGAAEQKLRVEARKRQQQEELKQQEDQRRQENLRRQEIDRNFRELRESAGKAARKSLEELANKKGPYTPEEQYSIQKQLACLVVNEKLNALEQANQTDGIPKDKESYHKMIREVARAKVFQNVLPKDVNPDILKGMLRDPKTVGTILKKFEKGLPKEGKLQSKESVKEQGKNIEKKEKEIPELKPPTRRS